MNTLFSKEELDKAVKQPAPEEPIEMPVAQHKLPREIVDFSSLTEFEQKVMALRAYLGRTGDSGKFKILANRNNLTMSEMNDIGMNICRKGFFEYPWGSKGNFNNAQQAFRTNGQETRKERQYRHPQVKLKDLLLR